VGGDVPKLLLLVFLAFHLRDREDREVIQQIGQSQKLQSIEPISQWVIVSFSQNVLHVPLTCRWSAIHSFMHPFANCCEIAVSGGSCR
jgi:hypothetical protein